MALVIADRVLETCTSPGTGTVSLLGAITGYQTFSAAIGNSNTTYYTISDQTGSNWEVGIGTYTSSGNTLARTTVLSSSNSGSLTNFSSGTQNVFCTYPSERAVYGSGTVLVAPSTAILPTANGGTALSSFTANEIFYASSSSAFAQSTNLQFNGTTLTANTLNLTNALGPAYGGTGVANNSASTITISGNYASTFSVSGAYTYTLPGATDTLVNLGSSQTLTSKTLTNPTVTNYVETLYSANTSTAITVSLSNGTVQQLTLTGNATITMPSAVAGKSFIIMLKQDSTGSRTVTWSTVVWGGGTAPTITSTASKQDIYSFFSDGTNWYGATIGQGY